MLLLPEMMAEGQERYEILREIHELSPVGRHLLTVQTKLPEETVRRHLEKMEKAGLLISRSSGISLSFKGESLLEPLAPYFQKSPALSDMEEQLKNLLSMERVIVVRGDSDTSPEVKKEISQEAALLLLRILNDGEVAAVSGGPMMAAVANALPSLHMKVDVIPARGGIGRKVEYLPNIVAAQIAEKLGGTYHILHIPDGLSPELFLRVKKALPQFKMLEELAGRTHVLLTGIDDVENESKWLELPADVRERLVREQAVGEALGIYVDGEGRVLYRLYNVGISKEDVSSIPHVLIAAGGSHKGKAILAVAKAGVRGILVTDEGAGIKILESAGSI